ncbi:hypothetical protein P691DRAFT_803477 [Macrolepiota fuliginosa MF-IS2]|uniref:Plasma membrane fusion protein PRM1 n=1 Tax=Macrolepiota fuliginosa MF-IS2 TaxID=1400762 RepID=A0A9P6C944_9AGAR|nr:hypothetical protein P691DRAFT_803477 [Macrolepiota fuliginosa MF-IS2]
MSAVSHSSAPWNSPPPTYDTQYMTTTLTPYLQLPHLLSLTWLAYPILSLLFVAFRLQLSLAASQDAVANAKDNLLTSCTAAEQAATSAASMPRFMALATNEQFVDAVNGSLNGARLVLTTSLTIMEAVVNFVVDLYRSTLLCFLELVVRGGLSILIGAVQEVNSLLQTATSSLKTGIQNDIQSANSAIQSFIDGVNKINPFSDIQAPQISVPSLDGLTNISLPSSFEDALTNLNSSLPTVADLKDKVESIIDTPFELLKKDINDTFAQISFNSSLMPVPDQNRLAFCNDIDMSVVDDIGHDLIKTAKIGIVILVVLALVLIGLNCLLTWYKWRCMKAHLEYTRQAWLTDPTMYHTKTAQGVPQMTLTDHNLLMLQANGAHPLLTRITNRLSQLFRLSPSQHTHMQWFFHYIFHPPAVAIFLIGFFGLLSVQLQLWAMGPLVAKYQDRAASTVSDFSNTIATSINNSMYNQSATYANQVNARVDAVQTSLNDGLFGWVNQTTTGLNSTINQFYTDVENAVNSVFGGTILEQPAQDFIRCFIGGKVDAIENALTFLHDNLKIDMPRMNESALMLSPSSVNEAVQPIAAAAIGGGNNDSEGLIGRLVNSYAASLKKERVMFGIFLGLWGVVVLMGTAILLWHSCGRELVEKRKRKKWIEEKSQGIEGMVVPFKDYSNGSTEGGGRGTPTPAWTAMNRALSPMDSKMDSEKAWDSHLGENQPKHSVEQKKGFIAAAKEKIKIPRKAPPPFIPHEERRHTAWFGKMATILGRKGQQENVTEERNIGKPELRSTSNDFADPGPQEEQSPLQEFMTNEPKSRWSKTPEATPTAPWAGILSPSKKSLALSHSASSSVTSLKLKSPPRPNAGLPPSHPSISPPRPLQPKHARNLSTVPSDIEPDDVHSGITTQSQPQQPQTLIPLHYGFETGPSRYPVPSTSRRYHQAPLSPSAAFNIVQQHRRSVSFPAMNRGGNMTGVGAGNAIGGAAGSLERLLTSSNVPHARQPSVSENPFVSLFDDEHRVKIAHPAVTRKSIPTNPFESGIAL